MRRYLVGTILAVAGVTAAQAQNPQQLDVRGGIWLPVDSTLRDVANIWAGIGVDVHFPTHFLKNAETVLSVDYLTHSLGGSKGNIFPINLNAYFTVPHGDQTLYYGFGAGAVIADVRSTSKTVFGLRGVLGLNINDEWFIEANYFWSDKYDDVNSSRASGLAGYIGFRF